MLVFKCSTTKSFTNSLKFHKPSFGSKCNSIIDNISIHTMRLNLQIHFHMLNPRNLKLKIRFYYNHSIFNWKIYQSVHLTFDILFLIGKSNDGNKFVHVQDLSRLSTANNIICKSFFYQKGLYFWTLS